MIEPLLPIQRGWKCALQFYFRLFAIDALIVIVEFLALVALLWVAHLPLK